MKTLWLLPLVFLYGCTFGDSQSGQSSAAALAAPIPTPTVTVTVTPGPSPLPSPSASPSLAAACTISFSGVGCFEGGNASNGMIGSFDVIGIQPVTPDLSGSDFFAGNINTFDGSALAFNVEGQVSSPSEECGNTGYSISGVLIIGQDEANYCTGLSQIGFQGIVYANTNISGVVPDSAGTQPFEYYISGGQVLMNGEYPLPNW